jgi:hypothetical protein
MLSVDPEIENYILALFNSDILLTAREGFSTINVRTMYFIKKTNYMNYDVLYWLYQKGLLLDLSKPEYIKYIACVVCFTTKSGDYVNFRRFMSSFETLTNLHPNFKNQIDLNKMINVSKQNDERDGEYYYIYLENDINVPFVLFTVSILNIKWDQNTMYTFFIFLELFIKKQLLAQSDFCIFKYKIQNQTFVDWFFSYEVHLFMNNSEFNLSSFDLVREIKEEKIKFKNVLNNTTISNDIIKYIVIPFLVWTIE